MTDIAVIPDIHADPARLEASIATADGARLAFLGDFVDAGADVRAPDDLAVLNRVRGLIEDERAAAVMGNHELNAILFHRLGADGNPLRPHLRKNVDQHASFLAAFGTATAAATDWTEWFLNLPLWRDLGGLRIVHACWDAAAIATVAERRPDGRLRHADLAEVAAKRTPFAKAVERLVAGPEVPLPEGWRFHDHKGVARRVVRLAWWRGRAATWRDAALSVPDPAELPDAPVSALTGFPAYPATEPPVLVGHYKMTGPPTLEAPQAACLDYPATPCLYRWKGAAQLTAEGLREVR